MRHTVHTPLAIGFVVALSVLVGVWVTVSAARVSSELESLEVHVLQNSRKNLNDALTSPTENQAVEEKDPPVSEAPSMPRNHHTMSHMMYTREDISKHDTVDDCWVIMGSLVYDITPYVPLHPGGKKSITKGCGTDVTASFARVSAHDGSNPADILAPYFKGMTH